MKLEKDLYIKPEVEVFELPQNLNLLNAVSLGGNVVDWEEGEDADWGTFVPY